MPTSTSSKVERAAPGRDPDPRAGPRRRWSSRASRAGRLTLRRSAPPRPPARPSSSTCACPRRRATTAPPTSATSRPRPARSARTCQPEAIVVNKSTVPVGSTSVVEQVLGRGDVQRGLQPRVPPRGHRRSTTSCNPDRVVIGADDQARGDPRRRALPRAPRARSWSPTRRRPRPSSTPPTPSSPRRSRFVNAIAAVCEAVGADVQRRRARHGLRQAHRPRLPPPGPGLGRQLLPEGLPRPASTSPTDAGYEFGLLARRHRRQRGAVRPGRRQGRRAWPAATSPARRVAVWGLTFKANTDDLPRLARAQRSSRRLARRRRRGRRPTTPRSTGPARRARGIEVVADPVRRLRGRRRARRAHRVGRVPLARPRQGRGGHGRAAASSTAATCSTAAACVRRGFAYDGIGRR